MQDRPIADAQLLRRSLTCAALALTLGAPAAHAAPVSGFAGFDHYAGAFGQRTHAWVAGAGLSAAAADVAVVGMRYDDTVIGRGYGVTGAAGVTLAPLTQLRIAATRFIGDETFRAWRTRVGPQFSAPAGQSLWLAWVHYQDNAEGRSDGAIAEASTPLMAGWTGRASASFATAAEGPAAVQGSVGLGWRVLSRLELTGEVGLARNASGATGPSIPNRGLLGLPPFGGGSTPGTTTTSEDVSPTALIGVRVLIP